MTKKNRKTAIEWVIQRIHDDMMGNPLGRAIVRYPVIASIITFWLLAFALETVFQSFTIAYINPSIWVATQFIVAYSCAALYFYVIVYGVKFRWAEYVGGQLIFSLTFVLMGIVTLNVIGLFLNPTNGYQWWQLPAEAFYWRPTLRLGIYIGAAVTLTAMDITLIRRLLHREPLSITVPPREDARK